MYQLHLHGQQTLTNACSVQHMCCTDCIGLRTIATQPYQEHCSTDAGQLRLAIGRCVSCDHSQEYGSCMQKATQSLLQPPRSRGRRCNMPCISCMTEDIAKAGRLHCMEVASNKDAALAPVYAAFAMLLCQPVWNSLMGPPSGSL